MPGANRMRSAAGIVTVNEYDVASLRRGPIVIV